MKEDASEEFSKFLDSLEIGKDSDEKILLGAIEKRISELLETDPGLLFSYFYRLDISEQKIQQILWSSNKGNVIEDFATLVFERQKQRIYSKKNRSQDPIDGWEW